MYSETLSWRWHQSPTSWSVHRVDTIQSDVTAALTASGPRDLVLVMRCCCPDDQGLLYTSFMAMCRLDQRAGIVVQTQVGGWHGGWH